MDKKYIVLVAVVGLLLVGFGAYMTGYTAAGEARGCDEEPYESDVVNTSKQTVCEKGDLVNVYDVVDGEWNFADEYDGPHAITATESVSKGYECYSCPPEKDYTYLLWVAFGAIALLGIGYLIYKKHYQK